MTRKQGRCLFCGGTGMTKEHAWGEWQQQVLPRSRPVDTFTTWTVEASPEDGSPELVGRRKTTNRDPSLRQFRSVCKVCNNGWMSVIQEEAKPIIADLMTGRSFVLDQKMQKIVARWSMMTMIMVENGISTLPEDREWLMNKLEPPPSWYVWIGRYLGNDLDNQVASFGGRQQKDKTQKVNGRPNVRVSAAVTGELVMQSFKLGDFRLPSELLDEASSRLRVWPSYGKDYSWPPERAFDRSEVFGFVHSFIEMGELSGRLLSQPPARLLDTKHR